MDSTPLENRAETRQRPGLMVGLVATWLICVSAGFVAVFDYEFTAGESAPGTPARMDALRSLSDPSKCTLVMFAHPQCPCTTASLNELDRLISDCRGDITVVVLFLQPAELEREFSRTSLWDRATELPGASVLEDLDGRIAEAVGATTSGYVILLSPDGDVAFSGGLTAGRGHEGESLGRRSIKDYLEANSTEHRSTPVFGCSLGPSTQ